MKNKLLFLGLLLFTFSIKAQYKVESYDGNEITDGEVIEYGINTYPDASLEFHVTNTSTETINMRIEFVSASNNSGDDMELCFGLCYTGINVGQSYPPNDVVMIEAGKTQNSQGDHFYNSADLAEGEEFIDYVFRFYQVDGSGNEIADTSLSFTYRYSPNLGLDDLDKVGVDIYSTIVSDQLLVTTEEELKMNIFDLQGRLVKSQQLKVGQQQIDVSSLNQQVYILLLENKHGASGSTKFILK